jgi:hypothetical protein
MRRSLLLISAVAFIAARAQDSKTIPQISKPAAGTSKPAAVHSSATPKKNKTTRTTTKKVVHREITHTAPDQRRIDSIKLELMKGKK